MIFAWMLILLGCPDPKTLDQDRDGFIASEDCNDDDPNVNPLADEVCNDVDDDCDGRINNDAIDGSSFLADFDGDGFGDDSSIHTLCVIEAGYVDTSSGGDCDDSNGTIFPGAVERCNEVDDDCNTVIDDQPEDGTYFFLDADGDGFGDDSESIFICTAPSGYIEDNTDCDDSSADTFPGSAEQDSPTACMKDADGDGYGERWVLENIVSGTDCDDDNDAISPSAVEICNEIDDDCDLLIDDADDSVADQNVFYVDNDGDGYGDATNTVLNCYATEVLLEDNTDCYDTDDEVNPSAIEICDGVDNDCDTTTSESGMVYRIDAQGVGTDLTATMASGTLSDPLVYEAQGAEELYFCEGTFSTLISTIFDLTIQGIGDVTLTADGANAPGFDFFAVRNYGDATETVIDGIVFDGYNVAIVVRSENDFYNSLTMNDSLIRNGYFISGGGIFSEYANLEIVDSYFEDGSSGYGGLAVTGSHTDVTLENVEISNTSTSAFIGVYLSNESTLEMNDTNISGFSSAGLNLMDSHGSCTNSSSTVSAAIASSGIGLYLSESTWESNDCDYQSSSAQEENELDIQIASEAGYYVGDNATFTCDETSCGTQNMQDFYASSSYAMSSKIYSNRYTAQADLTVRSFSVPLESSSCGGLFPCLCEIDFAMHTYDQGVWDEVWTNSRPGFSNGNVPSGNIGIPLRSGEQFALTVEYDCGYDLTYQYGSSSAVPSNSLLLFESSYQGTGGGDVSPEGLFEYSQTYYGQTVIVETVP